MAVMLVGFTIFFKHYEGLGWLEAFYFTVITTRTIGFGDISPDTVAGKWGTIATALLPATVFLGTSMVILDSAIRTLEQYWKVLVMKSHKNHTIVIANLPLLPSIIHELQALGNDFVVIADTPALELPPNIADLTNDYNYLKGDPANDSVLRQAKIDKAETILIATESDSTNLYVLVSAKGINPDILATVRVNNPKTEDKFRTVGADHLLPSSALLGRMLSQVSARPVSSNFLLNLNTRTTDPFMVEYSPSPEQCGQPVRSVYPSAIAVFSNDKYLYNLEHETLREGDTVLAISLQFANGDNDSD
jgi:voltage-gated potassium channel